MSRHHLSRLLLVICAGCALSTVVGGVASAQLPDTTWVRTFDHDVYSWADWHRQSFAFPDSQWHWSKIVLRYRIECPSGGCDPWDRLGYLRVETPTDTIEIARVVTPFAIPNRSCTWTLDVTDYRPFLHDQVNLANFISTWIGAPRGWMVTIDFGFVKGAPLLVPYKVVNLWRSDYAVYGDPARPIESLTLPRDILIDPQADAVKFRAIATGHGQGNTQNCTEFCEKKHMVIANGTQTWHYVWRSDCSSNPCHPQGGTWQYARAGWCPGDKVTPWDVDLTTMVTPGQIATLDYNIQDYVNQCRPDSACYANPPGGCTDCDYNSTGHTEPNWAFQTQLVYYKAINPADADQWDGTIPEGITVLQNSPNPFKPTTWIRYSVERPGAVRLVIYDASGRAVREIVREHAAAGAFRILWDGRNDKGQRVPAGVYFYRMLGAGGESRGERMLLLD